ncbi:MAG: hypothetical protein Rubg2KO_37120 [Rubricoccaceae bacterium]
MLSPIEARAQLYLCPFLPMKTLSSLLPLLLVASLTTACTSRAASHSASQTTSISSSDPCEENGRSDDGRARVCEEQTFTLDARDLVLDASTNGGVKVTAWDRDEIEVVARIQAQAPTESEARQLVEATRIETGRTVRAISPDTDSRTGRQHSWVSTSFEVRVPRSTDLDLKALNGGISVEGVQGEIRAETINGGISIHKAAGDVRARTTNGGVSVGLAGGAWDGSGLDVETVNGGISISIPNDYSADLTASTQMGRISADGLATRGRHQRGQWTGETIEGEIGQGGAPIRAVTTNGGVSIRRGR